MNTECPHKLRSDIPAPPARAAHLPIDARGYPVPFFVCWLNGSPEFRMSEPAKVRASIERGKCWVCGKPMTQPLVFVVGPMCAINRISGDPASHVECAEWSVKACPFLTKPRMVRREDELTEANKENVAGMMIERNPGVTALWYTRTYKLVDDGAGKQLFNFGEPERVTWWKEGREATRA